MHQLCAVSRLHQSVCCGNNKVSDSVRESFRLKANGPDIRRSWSYDQWLITVKCFWLKSCRLSCRRSVKSSLSSSKTMLTHARNNQPSGTRDNCVHFSRPLTIQYGYSPDLSSVDYHYGEKCSSGSTTFMPPMYWNSDWSIHCHSLTVSGIASSNASSVTQLEFPCTLCYGFLGSDCHVDQTKRPKSLPPNTKYTRNPFAALKELIALFETLIRL